MYTLGQTKKVHLFMKRADNSLESLKLKLKFEKK